MAEQLTDVIEQAREDLGGRLRTYTGADLQVIGALAAGFGPLGGSSKQVVQELSGLCARMALDPQAFYDSATIIGELASAQIVSTLRALEAISTGANSLLRWTRSTRIPPSSIDEIERLLEQIRKARFARSELTETVRTDLIALAQQASERLADLLSSEGTDPPAVPSLSDAEIVIEAALTVETLLNKFATLRSLYEQTNFEELATRRLLEGVDADLQTAQSTLEVRGVDLQAQADALGVTSALEVMLTSLLQRPETFGRLFILEAQLLPAQINTIRDVLLEPVPEQMRGSRASHSLLEEIGDQLFLRTMTSPSGWDYDTLFEQEVELAHDEDILCIDNLTALPDYLVEGQGTVVGEVFAEQLVDFVVYPDIPTLTFTHGPGANLGLLAYVDTGSVIVYAQAQETSPGSFAWVLYPDPGDPLEVNLDGDRQFRSTTGPLGAAGVEAGMTMELEKVSGTGPAFSGSRVVDELGFGDPTDFFGETFGVTFPVGTGITVYPDWVVNYFIEAFPAASRKWLLPYSGVADGYPPALLSQRSITIRQQFPGAIVRWTHRFVQTAVLVSDPEPGVELTFDVELSTDATVTTLYVSRVRGFDFPNSPYARISPQSAEEPLDIAPGDRIVMDVAETIDVRDPTVTVLSLSGDQLCLDHAFPTDPDFRSDVVNGGYVPGSTKSDREDQSLFAYADGRRYRFLREGDRVVMLPESGGADPGAPFAFLSEAETYDIDELTPDGIVLSPVNGAASPDGNRYARTVILGPNQQSTTVFRVLDSDTGEPVLLALIDREVRRVKADVDPDVELEDLGREQKITLSVRGAPLEAQRIAEDVVRVQAPTDVTSAPIPAQVILRDDEQGHFATLTVTDPAIFEKFTATNPVPSPMPNLGSAVVVDIESRTRQVIRSGRDPSDDLPDRSTSVRMRHPARVELNGPVARGGPPSYPIFAWAEWNVQNRTQPNYQELREDLGRAFADLGVARTEFLSGVNLNVSGDVLTVSAFSLPNIDIIAGMDVAGLPVSPDIPFRISSVTAVGSAPFTSATITLNQDLDVADGDYPVTLFETTIAEAWREILSLRAYLDQQHRYVSSLQPPEIRSVQDTATRLRRGGYDDAARVVETANFQKWVDPVGLSQRNQLAQKALELVSSLYSRRRSPMEAE